jgi:outer membrane protein with beta-barrel domain
MLKRLGAGAVVVAAALLVAGPAGAVENEHQLSLQGGLSLLKIDNKATKDVGGGLSLGYSYGLTDQFLLLADAGYSLVALGQGDEDTTILNTRPGAIANLGVGLGYVLDILTWVPYFGILAEGYYLVGGTIDGGLLVGGGAGQLGLDYKLSRHLSVGALYEQHLLFTKMSTYPLYFNAFARVSYSWGW